MNRALLLFPLLWGACHKTPVTQPDEATCFQRHVAYLADDALEGRGVGTEGLRLAGEYIATEMARIGLDPAFDDGFKQPFEVTTGVELGADNRLEIGQALLVKEDFMPLGFSASGEFGGGVAFVGYGITAEELGYDDYAGVDVEGKVVLAMRYEPGETDENSPFDGRRPTRWSDLRYKAHLARQAGAAALLLVSPGGDDEPDSLPGLRVGEPTSDAGLPVFQVTRAVANTLLANLDTDLQTLQAGIDASYAPNSVVVDDLEVVISGNADIKPTKAEVFNVVGVMPGQGALKDEVVVVGAHYDHLGTGGRGSLRPGEVAIHNGADDNASGVGAVLCGVLPLFVPAA